MAYTFKINYFANEVQLSYYQDGIMTSEKIEDDAAGVLPPAKEKKNKDDSDNKDDFEKYEKTDYEKEKENKKRSTRRSKQHIYDMARANSWDYFATFTFSSDRYDYGLCKKRLTKWFNNFKQRYCNDFEYLCVPEMHEDGAWHFHALIQSKQLPDYLSSGWHPGKYVISKYGLGICELEPVKDVNRVSMYITKYITKDLINNVKNKRRYFYSSGMSYSQEVKVNSSKSLYDFIETYFPEYYVSYASKSERTACTARYIQLKKVENQE